MSATAHADYPTYRQLADDRLATPLDDFWRAAFLAKAIPTAAKHADWATFARWLQQYRALPRSLRWDHSECAILNFEGLHALDQGRFEDAERILEAVVERAPSLQFLSNDKVSLLAKRMRTEGRAVGLCDRFDEITKERGCSRGDGYSRTNRMWSDGSAHSRGRQRSRRWRICRPS